MSVTRKPRIVWCGYREWSDRLQEIVRQERHADIVASFREPGPFADYMDAAPAVDIVVVIGWSWKIPEAIVNRVPCLGLHPSDLPDYRGGSPLQHQILDGLTETRCSLFLLTPDLDVGPVLEKTPMSLNGNMRDIFAELVRCGGQLLNSAFAKWPDWHIEEQDASAGFSRRRRKPEESRLERTSFDTLTLRQLYNFIRALGDPYPNAYIEDDEGNRLLFKEVVYIEKNKQSNDPTQ